MIPLCFTCGPTNWSHRPFPGCLLARQDEATDMRAPVWARCRAHNLVTGTAISSPPRRRENIGGIGMVPHPLARGLDNVRTKE
jgi:hypothetical protein